MNKHHPDLQCGKQRSEIDSPALPASQSFIRRTLATMMLLSTFEACAEDGTIDISPPETFFADAHIVSANGSIILSSAYPNNGNAHHVYKHKADGSMIDLGSLGGEYARASAVSADGSVIIGSSRATQYGTIRAFKYTDSTGMVDIGTLGGAYAVPTAISADGVVTVGESTLANGLFRAFKHTDDGGIIDLGTLGGSTAIAKAVSANGSVIAGNSQNADGHLRAFKYTESTGMVPIGALGPSNSHVSSMSADGSVIVGGSNTGQLGNTQRAFKYTDSTGMVALPLPQGTTAAYANVVSADGLVTAIHTLTSGTEGHAFTHTDVGGIVDIGTLGGGKTAVYAMSADGSVLVGGSGLEDDYYASHHAFKYTDKEGIVDLGTLGGTISLAEAISADGSVIVGWAETPTYETRAVLWKNDTIVDTDNTRTALAQTAQQATQVIDMRSAQLQMLMQQDCLIRTSDNGLCIGTGATYSGNGAARSTAASFTIGYQLTPQWRLGTTVNQSLDSSLPSEYKSSNNLPGIGIFTTFNARKDGLGWQARIAAAYQQSKVDINRKRLSHTEGGIGRADLDGKAVAVEGSYRMLANNGYMVTPYAALRYSNVHRGSYNETNGVEFIGRYAEMGRSATSVEAGLRVVKAISNKFNLSTDIGVIRDINVNNRDFGVAMDYVGGFSLRNDEDQRTRTHLGLQGSYAVGKDSAIQSGIWRTQQAYGNSTTSAQVRVLRQF